LNDSWCRATINNCSLAQQKQKHTNKPNKNEDSGLIDTHYVWTENESGLLFHENELQIGWKSAKIATNHTI